MTEMFKDQETQTPQIKVEKTEDGKYVVGDKVYNDDLTLAQSKAEADAHINKVQLENKQLRSEKQELAEQRKLLEQIMDGMSASKPNTETNEFTEYQQEAKREQSDQRVPNTKIQKEELQGIVRQEFETIKAKDNFTRNQDYVKSELVKAWGSQEGAAQAWKKYKESADFDEELVNAMVQRQPNTLLNLLSPKFREASQAVSFGDSASSGSNYRSSDVQTSQHKGWSHWKKLLKDNPREYWATHNEVKRSAATKALGDKFMKT